MNLAKITRLLCCIVDISECSYLCVKYLRYRFNVGYSCVGCFCIRLHFRSDIVLPWTTKVSQRSGNSAFPAVMSICGYIHAYLCISDRASITFISVNYLMLNSSFSLKQLCFACSSLQLLWHSSVISEWMYTVFTSEKQYSDNDVHSSFSCVHVACIR